MAGKADTIGSMNSMTTTDFTVTAISSLEKDLKSGVTTIRDGGY